jgi:heme exporter protein D
MNGTAWCMIILVVALIVGPFATLRAVSEVRSRRARSRQADTDKSGTP